MLKIAVITGTRAEYGIYKPLLHEIRKHPDMKLSLLVAGMHLLEDFGNTIQYIEKDGFSIDAEIKGLFQEDNAADMAHSVGRGIEQCANAFSKLTPDILLVLGDRPEMLAGAIAALYMNILIGHIHGGDLSGSVDGIVRHAITKLAHIHFPATQKSAERIISMGEDPERVFIVGALGLDSVLHTPLLDKTEITTRYHLDSSQPILLLIQHPVTTELGEAGTQIHQTLTVLAELHMQTVVVYPNADAGGREMIKVINSFISHPLISAYQSIPHEEYLSLLNVADVLIGNSSSGIIEAPAFGLPVVNIGTRQQGRERAENVIDVGYSCVEIKSAICQALTQEFKKMARDCCNPYGDGIASERICDILRTLPMGERLHEKRSMFQ